MGEFSGLDIHTSINIDPRIKQANSLDQIKKTLIDRINEQMAVIKLIAYTKSLLKSEHGSLSATLESLEPLIDAMIKDLAEMSSHFSQMMDRFYLSRSSKSCKTISQEFEKLLSNAATKSRAGSAASTADGDSESEACSSDFPLNYAEATALKFIKETWASYLLSSKSRLVSHGSGPEVEEPHLETTPSEMSSVLL